MWICANLKCKHEFDHKPDACRCSHCGGKMFFKRTPAIARTVSTD